MFIDKWLESSNDGLPGLFIGFDLPYLVRAAREEHLKHYYFEDTRISVEDDLFVLLNSA